MDEMSTIRMCYTNKKYSKQNVFGFLTTTLCFSVRDERQMVLFYALSREKKKIFFKIELLTNIQNIQLDKKLKSFSWFLNQLIYIPQIPSMVYVVLFFKCYFKEIRNIVSISKDN